MQLTRCPVCHSRLNLDTLVQDEAGRGLLAILAKLDRDAAGALVSYLSLFRSNKRDLANDRALRLAGETLELASVAALVPALAHTVEQMRAKQMAGGFKPLSNHNYLRRVLESRGPEAAQGDIEALPAGVVPAKKADARAAVTGAIMDIRDTDW